MKPTLRAVRIATDGPVRLLQTPPIDGTMLGAPMHGARAIPQNTVC